MRSAVIDIGSNAIRAVVYDGCSIGANEIYNEKFKSDILNLLKLANMDIKHHTYLIFEHFVHIFKRLNVKEIKCIATAVLRDKPNTPKFCAIIKEKFNIDIEVISGEVESYLGAQAVLMVIPDADGIVADLGGGSLELCRVKAGQIFSTYSIPIGAKNTSIEIQDLQEYIAFEIAKLFSNDSRIKSIYFIGGNLRFIGRMYMSSTRYPLKNLHHFPILQPQLMNFLDRINQVDESAYENIEEKPTQLNISVEITKAIMQFFNPEFIIISNYGLKEGVRFEMLSPEEKRKNVVLERIKQLFKIENLPINLNSYTKLISDLIAFCDKEFINNIEYAIMLSNGMQNVDKSFRANPEVILFSEIPFSHSQRIIVALIISTSYRAKIDLKLHKLARKLINSTEYYNCLIVGHLINIARCIDGPEFSSPNFEIYNNGKYLEIRTGRVLPSTTFAAVHALLKEIGRIRKRMLHY